MSTGDTVDQDLPYLRDLMKCSHFHSWHFVAGCRNLRVVRDGVVLFIREA